MADGGQVERFVVVSACGEHRAIAQSRCRGLTGTDIHIYIHTYNQSINQYLSASCHTGLGPRLAQSSTIYTNIYIKLFR